ncbi:cysteine-rich TM module stress tolerance protein [Arabidopsis thaliana]|uniref:Cysteine-rich TM module stress tolerance protein n=1 Tax=Arabidopsis thaliana TaxID=3702 RepID=F4KI52_ARATH|nr:cysteine-rich TM module stress tolerance protein [Arabidopsis thaliana]AED90696.1 cysteine-rich TM module stress tolerance protein [Arabidopsis thaliana]|eukprot:NP_001190222.1 cysteine-rich TM module stress tolerance protein [Arabidopsis thaliana]
MQDMRDQNPPQAAEQVSEQPGQDKKKKKPRFFETKQKGDRGFIEGW